MFWKKIKNSIPVVGHMFGIDKRILDLIKKKETDQLLSTFESLITNYAEIYEAANKSVKDGGILEEKELRLELCTKYINDKLEFSVHGYIDYTDGVLLSFSKTPEEYPNDLLVKYIANINILSNKLIKSFADEHE